jgi:hypothetical protein
MKIEKQITRMSERQMHTWDTCGLTETCLVILPGPCKPTCGLMEAGLGLIWKCTNIISGIPKRLKKNDNSQLPYLNLPYFEMQGPPSLKLKT